MDFDDAKENIQPLAQGRNASILHASLRVESPQELLAQRKELEKEIHSYSGDDPLSVWYNYIEWIEQSFPSGGKESGLQEVLSKCLAEFESDDRYKQDRRMIKLYIKFIDSHKDPAECYQQLFSAGIGTMVADFYIAWAYCYGLVGNTRKADEIFLQGISCRAQPLEELQEARQHFGFSVAQRLLYKDDDSIRAETDRQLQERRMALISLRGHRRKQMVGSIRTGSAVKSVSPGTIKIDLPSTSSKRGNTRVQVFKDENENPNVISSIESTSTNDVGKSVVRSIIDTVRNQENEIEPGPWNKAQNRKKGKLFGKSSISNELGFEIHEDDQDIALEKIKTPCVPPIPIADNEIKFDKPFLYPENFYAKSKPVKGWLTPVTTEEMPDKNTIPEYNKCKLYPRPNMEFQPEELKAFNIMTKSGIENEFTKERDVYWGCGAKYNIRLYPHFATKSKPQSINTLDQLYIPEKIPGLVVAFDEIYNKEENVERQFEELLALRNKCNETNIKTTDMEETMCVTSEKIKLRKSFFPMRKSLAPSTFKASDKMAVMTEQNEKDGKFAISDLSSSTSVSPVAPKVVECVFNSNPAITDGKIQSEASQVLKTETASSKFIPVLSEQVFTEDKCSKILPEVVVADIVSTKQFDSVVGAKYLESPLSPTKPSVSYGNDFQFKTPALPTANSTSMAGVSNKLPFEIFDDETLSKKSPNSIPKPDFSCGTGAYFDSEETCSTQTFNLFLKAQSVSTPKAITKLQPQKQFGNILKEITSPTIPVQKDNHHITSSAEIPNYTTGATPAVSYSPPRQQLSTILETSEHGTTQGTHTTGATTKSTISSPEFEIDSQVQTTTNTGTNHPPTVLETIKELSCDKIFDSLKIQSNVDFNTSKAHVSEKNIETPGAMRLQKKCGGGGLDFSIFEDSIKIDEKHVGNFSRLEEKEDTAAGYVYKEFPPIRFQDDKTETLPKMLITSQQAKFQDDKTETISKMMCELQLPTQFQEDTTETIPKMIMDPLQPIHFPEDKTKTISKLMLTPPDPAKFEDEKTDVIKINKEKNLQENVDKDDSFEFFGHTPPKPLKQCVAKQISRGLLSHVRTTADIPEIQKPNSLSKPEVMFEGMKNKYSINLNTPKGSLFSDFSLSKENRPLLEQSKNKPKIKSVLRDSFIPEFSIIEDSQPQTKEAQSENENEYILSKFLLKNTTLKSGESACTNPQKSILSDFFHVSETQPNESIIKSSQQAETRYLKADSKQSSGHNNFSKTDVEKNNVDNINWKQASNSSFIPNSTQSGTTLKNVFMDTFKQDFSEINESRKSNNLSRIDIGNQKHFFENNSKITNISINNATKLNFLAPELPADISSRKEMKSSAGSDGDKYFELNCETEMFGTDNSMIKNSTWLPSQCPSGFGNAKQFSQIREKSLHIKPEDVSSNTLTCSASKTRQILRPEDSIKPKQNFVEKAPCSNEYSIEISASELASISAKSFPIHTDKSVVIQESPEHNEDDCEMSIYYKETPKTPQLQVHIWDDADSYKPPALNHYIHAEPDHNQTHHIIENMCIDPNVNPFNVDLINAFLEQHYVISYLESLPTCKLVGSVQRLKPNTKIDINGITFNVIKLIGEGAYGAVFCGKETSTGKLVAMKQEKPPNFWEYYICLEIQERIQSDEMLKAYMSVDYALIGNNCSILISNFCPYGTLITVCNKIKKHTLKNVDEYVVMLLASELLEIMDHLHAVNIIHADIKPDNFLLMNKLTYPPTQRHLQLIDFGVSIDMKLFKQGQTFTFVHNDNTFKCPEMREKRPWTYQLDLYGLASILHVLLFGKYMEIEKARGFWMHKTHVPRYLNKNLWNEIFKTLLNIRDCNSMPNLQDLRALLKKEVEERDKYVLKMVNEFNRALSS